MGKTGPALLLTRPEAQSLRFAEQFRRRFGSDWRIVVSPLSRIHFLPFGPIPAATEDVIFTSENGVKAFARQFAPAGRRAWCVGPQTAEAARSAGLVAVTGPGDALGLIELIKRDARGRNLLYPHGRHQAYDVGLDLNSAGIETISIVAYEQIDVPPSDEARALTAVEVPVLLPLFSARSAKLAVSAFAQARAAFDVAAISPAVARSFALCAHRLAVADTPDGAGMLTALAQLIESADMG